MPCWSPSTVTSLPLCTALSSALDAVLGAGAVVLEDAIVGVLVLSPFNATDEAPSKSTTASAGDEAHMTIFLKRTNSRTTVSSRNVVASSKEDRPGAHRGAVKISEKV
jgi:hypothetical protein